MIPTIAILHAVGGFGALATGACAMVFPKRRGWHTRVGILYFSLALFTCLSALLLVTLKGWASYSILGVLAIATGLAVLIGFAAARKKWRGWLSWHIIAQLSSYISMVTAFAVVNRGFLYDTIGLPPAWSWFLPTIIGTPLIVLVVSRATKPRLRKGKAA